MYDIENLKIELSSLGNVTYCEINDRSDYFVIVIEDFIDEESNVTSYYSIVGKYLTDFKVNQLDITNNRLKSDLNKII